jgi:hypothetical protein
MKKSVSMPNVSSNIKPFTVSDKLSVSGLDSTCGQGSSMRSRKQGDSQDMSVYSSDTFSYFQNFASFYIVELFSIENKTKRKKLILFLTYFVDSHLL